MSPPWRPGRKSIAPRPEPEGTEEMRDTIFLVHYFTAVIEDECGLVRSEIGDLKTGIRSMKELIEKLTEENRALRARPRTPATVPPPPPPTSSTPPLDQNGKGRSLKPRTNRLRYRGKPPRYGLSGPPRPDRLHPPPRRTRAGKRSSESGAIVARGRKGGEGRSLRATWPRPGPTGLGAGAAVSTLPSF